MDYEFKNNDSFADFKTARYYSTRAASLAEKYAEGGPDYIRFSKKERAEELKLLDIGCGSGRDLAEFQKAGFTVTGADVSAEMLDQAALKYPSIKKNLLNTGLPALSGITEKFDIILCSGVIQHIENQHLYESFRNISSLLNDGGIFIFSFPVEYPDIDPKTERDKYDRLFIIRPEEKYRFLIERQGLVSIEREIHEDALKRSGTSWALHVYRKKRALNDK